MLQRIQNLISWPPPIVGERPHPVSLTADEGTWVKLEDFQGHLNVVFVVFDSLTNDEVDDWLHRWDKTMDQFESLETVVFGMG